MINLKKYKFIFIGGLHRSGTSILFKCLKENPYISGHAHTGKSQDEGQHLQTVYPPAYSNSSFIMPYWGFNPNSYVTEKSKLITQENRIKLFTEWARYWDLSKYNLIEKSPPNITKMRFLQAMFPNTYFIIIKRNPIAVAFSSKRALGRKKLFVIEELIKQWVYVNQVFEQDKEHIKNLYSLTYEDFCINPQEEMNKIYSFLHIKATDIKEYKIENDDHIKYFDKVWNQDASYREIEENYEYLVNKFGYSLKVGERAIKKED